MPRGPSRRAPLLLLVALVVILLAGCGRGGDATSTATAPSASTPAVGGPAAGGPAEGAEDDDGAGASVDLGFPGSATKNTTRVDGSDPVALAAQAALATFPATSSESRPPAVALADRADWRGALAATALAAPPVRAPLLLSDGDGLPAATQATLGRLAPPGSSAVGRAQVVRVGDVPRPDGERAATVTGRDPAALARAMDAFVTAARGSQASDVLIVSSEAPEYAAPAAAWSARTGDPILFVTERSVPADTTAALRTHGEPRIWVLGPSKVIGPEVTRALRGLGTVERIGDQDPVSSAVAFARYRRQGFGFGIAAPGHGFVVARADADPATAPAVAVLSSAGTYGPLLLTTEGDDVPKPLSELLLDVKPGFLDDPTNDGVYNRGWVVGDQAQITVAQQARLDSLLEAVPVQQPDDAGAPNP